MAKTTITKKSPLKMTIMTKTIFITKMTLTTIKYDLKNTYDLNYKDNLNNQDADVGYNQEQ